MSAPKNNLEELRRKQGHGSRAQSPEPSAISAKVTRFKPSKSLQTPENVTIRKQPSSLPAFRTSGFRKDIKSSSSHKPVLPANPSLSVVDISSDEEVAPRKSRVPVKRMSSGSAYDPETSSPSKRPKVDPSTEKENRALHASGKGKARAQPDSLLDTPAVRDPPLSPRRRVVNVEERVLSHGIAAGSKPLPPLNPGGAEWPDLASKSADELGRMLYSNCELGNTINEKILKYHSGEDADCDVTCMLEISKLIARRNKAIMAAKTMLEGRAVPNGAHARSLSAAASPAVSIPMAHTAAAAHIVANDTRPSDEEYTVVKKTVVQTRSSANDAPMQIPDSDDIWDSVEEIPIERRDIAEEEMVSVPSISRQPAELSSSSPFDSAMASSSTAESSSAALSRHIVQLAAVHSKTSQVPKDLTKTPFYPEVKRKLRSIFSLTTFRPNQLEAISTTLSGEDAVVLMQTGGGKSLCYQLPAVCDTGKTRGVTVVICPLLALMQDQVDALKHKGVDVAYFMSGQNTKESDQVTRRLRSKGNRPRIFYITPEKLKHSSIVLQLLNEIRDDRELARFVIDEAHLVIKWGRDFREAYKYVECLRTNFPGIPIMALTATATPQVKEDLIRILGIRGCKVFWQSMNRPNLNYEVRPKKSVEQAIVQFIRTYHPNETGIIYARSRRTCEELAVKLRDSHGLKARHFHAGMQPRDKQDALDQWQSDQCKIIVATIAFGMGIDKPDVRYVIHHDLPNDLDGYYQETGRAGRDGKPADCILYYSFRDVTARRRQIRDNQDCDVSEREHQEQEIFRVANFCSNNVDCRRTQVLAYYNETFDPVLCDNGCDNCRDPSGIEEEDVTDMTIKIIRLAEVLIEVGKQNVTSTQLLEVLWGKSNAVANRMNMQSHELFGSGRDMSRDRTERIAHRLEYMGIFRTVSRQNGEWSTAYLQVTPKARAFINEGHKLVMKFRAKPAIGTKRRKRASAAGEEQPPAAESSRKAPKRNAPAPAPEEVMDLYQDDDVFDFGSPKKPTTRSQSRAAAIAVDIDEIEDADDEEEDPEQPYKLLDSLKDVRARIAEEQDIVDPVHIIADDDLFAIATLQPADNQSLQEALADADVSATFWAHAGEFLACYKQGSGVQTRFKPASAVSISSLHQQFTYQGRS